MCCFSLLSNHFSVSVYKLLYFCSQGTFLTYLLERVLCLCKVHIFNVPSWNCCVSVLSTHYWYTVFKLLRFCSHVTFLMYRLEIVVFLCTVHFSDIPSGNCFFLCSVHICDVQSGNFVSVLSTLFWCTVWKLLCFCCQYKFLMYRL